MDHRSPIKVSEALDRALSPISVDHPLSTTHPEIMVHLRSNIKATAPNHSLESHLQRIQPVIPHHRSSMTATVPALHTQPDQRVLVIIQLPRILPAPSLVRRKHPLSIIEHRQTAVLRPKTPSSRQPIWVQRIYRPLHKHQHMFCPAQTMPKLPHLMATSRTLQMQQ